MRKFVPTEAASGGATSATSEGSGGAGEEGGAGVEAATVMTVCLSSDRRVVDEATAARFLDTFRGYIENPGRLYG